MPTLPKPVHGANPARWQPSNPDRWAILGLADGHPDARLPEQGSTADLLAFGLVAPGATDPIEGIIDAVKIEVAALADAAPTRAIADALHMINRRLEVASLLLARCDNRTPPPPVTSEERAAEAEPATPLPEAPKRKTRRRR